LSIFLKDSYGNSRLTAGQILKDPVLFLAFGFGSGLSRYMPGTMGTVAALPVYFLLAQTPDWFYSVATLLITLVGVPICDAASRKLDVHDFGGIVIDEIAGLLITLWFVPFSWQAALLGFALFRVFDIAKPWPIRWIDRKVEGGFGIMFDDVLAGLFAAGVLVWVLNVLSI
jgi:phosphatidylglycerophosphatase A